MKIFDCHFHIDKGLGDYNILSEKKNIIFNSVHHFQTNTHDIGNDNYISLIYDFKDNYELIHKLIDGNMIDGLKIHSRIQKIKETDYQHLFDVYESMQNCRLPVIIDAFYYGSDLEFQPNLNRIIEMVKLFPESKFIIAHSGGIKVLEYFLHMKNLKNVYFDLSFSLSYLRNSSVFKDYKVLIKYANHDNLLFGTDYPYINAEDQLKIFMEIVSELRLSDDSINRMLYKNSNLLFKK